MSEAGGGHSRFHAVRARLEAMAFTPGPRGWFLEFLVFGFKQGWACLFGALMLVLLLGFGHIGATLVFALLFGVGNGMLTIVKGTVMAQYVSAAHVGALNGALGLPLALARAAVPLAVGLLWSPAWGYTWGLALLLGLSLVGVAALWQAQRLARAP